MSNLTPDELARLRLKAKHGMLTPEEQQAYDDYATEQLSAVSSPPSGAVPPKKGFKWESEKVAEWRLKARHDGLDENERLLYQDYQQTLALAEADANASDAKFTGESSERQLKKSAILRGVMSLALVVLIGMYVMTGCKLSESPFLVQYTMYEINYRLTGELPDTNEVWSNYLDMTKSQAGVPLVAITGAWDLGSFLQNTHSSVARLELVGGVPDECFFDEVVSGLRGTSDMTEVHRHIYFVVSTKETLSAMCKISFSPRGASMVNCRFFSGSNHTSVLLIPSSFGTASFPSRSFTETEIISAFSVLIQLIEPCCI